MDCGNEKKENWEGKQVEVLGPCYEPGAAKGSVKWRDNMESRKEFLAYLKESERYWYTKNEDWYGSEKRKTPA